MFFTIENNNNNNNNNVKLMVNHYHHVNTTQYEVEVIDFRFSYIPAIFSKSAAPNQHTQKPLTII